MSIAKTVTEYKTLQSDYQALLDNIDALNKQRYKMEKDLAVKRKAIRNSIETTLRGRQATGTMKGHGRTLKIRQNAGSVTVLEKNTILGHFRNRYDAEYAFAVGEI